jgi:outer membrane lipoprotein-sorting protein
MTRIVICVPLLLTSLAAALCTGCAQRDSGAEASRKTPRETAPEGEAEAPPRQAAPSYRTVDLGYFNEMIEQFAAAETLLLCMEAQPEGFELVRKEYKLRRPDCFHTMHEFDGRGGERICNGETIWMISRARKEYFEMPVVPGRPYKLGLLPDLFRSARQIATGEDTYARTLADAQRIETETIRNEPCDVVEVELDQPRDSKARVWLTQTRRLPLRVRMISANGVIDYEVRALAIGVELDDATFTFVPGPDWTGGPVPPPPPPTPETSSPGVSERETAEVPDNPPDEPTDDRHESAPDADEQADKQ